METRLPAASYPKEAELPAPPCRRGETPHLLVPADCATTPPISPPSASPRSGETSRLAVSDAGRIRPPCARRACNVAKRGATRHLCSAKRRCIVYVVMFCASRDHKSWQGVASLRDAGANTYTPIYALCADAGQFAVSLHKSPVAPLMPDVFALDCFWAVVV